MATQPTPAPAPTSALVPVGETGVTFNLDAFPEGQFNRLIPTQTIRMASDLMVPVVQVVQLDPRPDAGDVYHSNDMKDGHNAPTARALSKLATAAGVSFFDERRVDDGKDPNVCGVTVYAEMTLPTGQRQRVPGSKWVDMGRMHWSSPAQAGKFRSFLYETNMNHPEIRARIIEAMAPTVAQLYGPSTPAPQLAAGQVVEGPEAPDDDEGTVDGQAREVEPEPDWFGTTPTPPAAAAPQTRVNPLPAALREKAASSGMVGPVTAPQKDRLQAIFKAGIGLEATAAGLRIVFGLKTLGDITGAQAQAVIECSVSADFADLWRDLVAGDGAPAG
jgi:hypothetical protein